MKLETKRLVIRKPRLSDWMELVEKISDKSITQGIDAIPYPYRKKDAIKFLNDSNKEWAKKKKNKMDFLIFHKEENELIGGFAIGKIDRENRVAFTGSWIARKYRRKGYITEAKVTLNDYAFNVLGMRKLNSLIYSGNNASIATQKKMGYKQEAFKRKERISKITGKPLDVYHYGLLKEDWKKVRARVIRNLKKYY